ncbi:MAG: TolC family protein [Deltaproteobacteria bacterium]|nr:TolC family protein [Deltaproteobacteria bacterium]
MSLSPFWRGAVLGLCWMTLWSQKPAAADEKTEIEKVIDEAIAQNAELAAERETIQALQARVPQAGALEDPRLGFGVTNLPVKNPAFNTEEMTGKEISINQMVPFPGKLSLMKKAEKEALASAKAMLEDKTNEIRYEVEETYFELYRVDKAIEVLQKNRGLLNAMAEVTQARYAVGDESGADVFRAQTMATELESELLAMEQERQSLGARLNQLLNRPIDTPFTAAYDFSRTPLPAKPQTDQIETAPRLEAMGQEVEKAKTELRVAKREYWPDFDFGLSYMQRDEIKNDPMSGSDLFAGSVMINIPLWAHWRQSRKVEEMAAEKRSMEHHYHHIRNELLYEVEETFRTLERQDRQLSLFEQSLLPQTQATYESAYFSYQTEQADFFSTIEALKTLLETELAFYELESNYQITHARLNWIVGMKEEQP